LQLQRPATSHQSPSCSRRRGRGHALSSFNARERACACPIRRRVTCEEAARRWRQCQWRVRGTRAERTRRRRTQVVAARACVAASLHGRSSWACSPTELGACMSDGNPLGGLAHLDSVGPLILPSKYCMLQRPRGRKKLLAELRATAAQLKRTVAAAILLAGGRGTGHWAGRASRPIRRRCHSFATSAAVTCSRSRHRTD
jgi:hypothetical protein